MTEDISEFLQLTSRTQKKPCKIGLVLEKLKPADRKKLIAALAEDKSVVSGGAIKLWLAQRNLDDYLGGGVYAVANHRSGRCSCNVR